MNENELLLIRKYLNGNKARGLDDISIRMIKACGKPIALPLNLLFKTILEEETFSEDWRKSNVAPIHKKRVQESDKKLSTYQSSSHIQ